MSKMLTSRKLMDQVIYALKNKKPLSVISVGATESFVMAQDTVLSKDFIMNHPEAWVANQGVKSGFHHRGIRFPNLKLRDEVVDAVRKADIVGYNMIVNTMDGGLLTEKVFDYYKIKPKYIYECYIRRVLWFSQRKRFEEVLRNKRILLIGSVAEKAKEGLNLSLRKKLKFSIVGTISIYEYEDIPRVKEELEQYDFDLCLIAAGTNAIILASYIKEKFGKVAIDLGFGMETFYTNKVFTDGWLTDLIGINRIMKL